MVLRFSWDDIMVTLLKNLIFFPTVTNDFKNQQEVSHHGEA